MRGGRRMNSQDTTVVMVISDSWNMARSSLRCLRRHFKGHVLLVDISRQSEIENNELAREYQCSLKRLMPFDERQFYAHSTALDCILPTVKTEFAILLDNDCFVFSDSWESRLLEPFLRDPGCAAAGPPRGGTVVFGGITCHLLGTWSTRIRVSAIVDTGISLFNSGSGVIDDAGKTFQIDTMDANIILAAIAGHSVAPLDDIDKHCFHIGAVTTGNHLLKLYDKHPESFRHYFGSLLRFDSANMLPMLHRLMINAYRASLFFGDATVDEKQFSKFKEEEVSRALAERFEDNFTRHILPKLKSSIGDW
jgi:hypothetical protein